MSISVKLKDFLKQFDGMDPEADMQHMMYVGCCGDTELLEEPTVEPHKFEFKKEQYSYVYLYYPALDFLSSCRKYGSARDKK